jgi:GNAT superfamily N-acetyltransferase
MGKFSPPQPNRPISADVTSDVFETTALPASVWNEIWTLTAAFFDTERAYAEAKLKEHQLIALFRTKEGKLIGMASMDVYPVSLQGRSLAIIYTVYVLLHEEYRGHNLIQRLGLRMFLKTRFQFPFRSIYWFFDTYSYKGYVTSKRFGRIQNAKCRSENAHCGII